MKTIAIPEALVWARPNAVLLYFYVLRNGGSYSGTRNNLCVSIGLTYDACRKAECSLVADQCLTKVSTRGDQINLYVSQQVTIGLDQCATNVRPKVDQWKEDSPPSPPLEETQKEKKKTLSIESKKRKTLDERRQAFYDSLVPFVEEFGAAMVREFYDYWSEPYQNADKFRKEGEKTWDTKRRLTTWKNRDKAANAKTGMSVGVILNAGDNKKIEGW